MHESIVQPLLSSQEMGVNTHWPLEVLQESVVQRVPSSQVLGVYTQPVDEWQVSVVQGLLSLHTIVV